MCFIVIIVDPRHRSLVPSISPCASSVESFCCRLNLVEGFYTLNSERRTGSM